MTTSDNGKATLEGAQRFNLIASIAAISVLGFAMGLTFPALSLLLEAQNYSSLMIGLNAAAQPLGTIVSVFATPYLVRTVGAKRAAIVSAVGTAAVLVAYPLASGFIAWCVLRFIQGFLFSVLFAISEAWVVEFAEGPYRSRILSLYMSFFGASLAAGPLVVAYLGASGVLPFLVGAVVLVCVALPIGLVEGSSAPEAPQKMPLVTFIARNWVLIIAVATFAFTEITSLGLLPIFGTSYGMTEARSAMLASVFVAGPILLQFPIGWLSDRFDKKTVWLGCIGLSAVGYLLLPLIATGTGVWPLLLLLGALTASFYTFALTYLGQRYEGHELVTGTAIFSATYGVGSFSGSTLTGSAMTLLGPNGLPYLLAAAILTLMGAVAASRL